ncbi:hypothetical protein ABPG74_016111 [Tetrahymena malaccensis]
MKIQQTIFLISIIALLGLTAVITLKNTNQGALQDDNVPCLGEVIKGDTVYAKNICSQSKQFTVIIYDDSGFSRDYTQCLKHNEMESVAYAQSRYRIAQQFDC